MIRFSAGCEEIGGLLRFLRCRSPQGRLFIAPLQVVENHRAKRLFQRTERPLMHRLSEDEKGGTWALFTYYDRELADTNAAPLLVLHLSATNAIGRREGLLEARDEISGEPPDYTLRCRIARDLVGRCARRVRYRGASEKNRWALPL